MTLFQRFFATKNKSNANDPISNPSVGKSSDGCQKLELRGNAIRVLLYRECERRGRKLLFDSDAVERISLDSACMRRRTADAVEVNASYAYKYKKPCSDVTCIGEMIFGSVALSIRGGATCKIHNISEPKRLLFTTIIPTNVRCHNRHRRGRRVSDFVAPQSATTASKDDNVCSSDSKLYRNAPESKDTLTTSNGLLSPLRRTVKSSSLRTMADDQTPRKVSEGEEIELLSPGCLYETEHLQLKSRHSASNCSSINGSCSSCHSFASVSESRTSTTSINCSGGSLTSLRRRWNQTLSMSQGSSSATCDDSNQRFRTKLGIALLVDISGSLQSELEEFFLNQSLSLDRILAKLRWLVEEAYSQHENFVHLTHGAFLWSQAAILELVNAPQYLEPRWLHQVSTRVLHSCRTNARKTVSTSVGKSRFVAEFAAMLNAFDVKDTNFFVSTLLSAVLTHNLSWVSGVAARFSNQHQSVDEKGSYNPLWAQMCDLFGVIGSPLKLTKIILVGSETRKERLAAMLNLVSYFVRCDNIVANSYDTSFTNVTSLRETMTVPTEPENKLQEDNFDSGVDCEMRDAMMAFDLSESASGLYPDLSDVALRTGVFDVFEETCFEQLRVSDMSAQPKQWQASDVPMGKFVGSLSRTERPRDCCNSLQSQCKTESDAPLYPSIEAIAVMENVRVEDLTSMCDSTVFVQQVLDGRSFKNKTDNPKETPMAYAMFRQSADALNDKTEIGAEICAIVAENTVKRECSELQRSLAPAMCIKSPTVAIRKENSMTCERKAHSLIEDSALSPDEGYDTIHNGLENTLLSTKNIQASRTITTKSSTISLKRLSEESATRKQQRRRKRCHDRSQTINIPVLLAAEILQQRSRTLEDVAQECIRLPEDEGCVAFEIGEQTESVLVAKEQKDSMKNLDTVIQIPMYCCPDPVKSQPVAVCGVINEVSRSFNPHYALQGVTQSVDLLEKEIYEDLQHTMAAPVLVPDLSEAVSVVADLQLWVVNLHTTRRNTLGSQHPVRVASSQMVADMLESFAHLYRIGISPQSCLEHLERKLAEIYRKSEAVAEMLMTTESCTLELLTRRLGLAVNDVPLLLSVATTHTPQLSDKYGVSFS